MKRRDFVAGALAAGATTLLPAWAPSAWASAPGSSSTRLDHGWRFLRGDAPGAERPGHDDRGWERVTLPHTARIEALVTGPAGSPSAQWQGLCWYRLPLRVGPEAAGMKALLHFEAAMNVAEVWLDGEPVGGHLGGWLPFTVDLGARLSPGRESLLAVRLDNRDNPVTGPKPLHLLDFNYYHGLYRYVHLVLKDPLHLTDPLLAGRPGSGGVFVTYPRADRQRALVRVQTHLRNDHPFAREVRVRSTLRAADGRVVASATTPPRRLATGDEAELVQELEVIRPELWSPRAPHLHTLHSELLDGERVADQQRIRVGIRRISIGREGFEINGESMFLRGTNRHQEHPWVGYAVPAAAQYRDARRIKEAGFDYIRLSHYPHAPAFMDACDELGLVVMNCIPGWQYFGSDPAFAELQHRNCRDLIRRDRNRPSVILWEVSLNETAMPPEFIQRTHAIAHQEYPGDQCYSCGWMHGYDVFIQARQHGGCTREAEQPCVVSEYGDWEYYAMTAGLDQESWSGLSPAASNSRQLRWQGESAQLQQAANFQEAHNDNRATAAFADGLWVMYDYLRGYSPDVESSGCMDLLRLPKYSWHFFRSQRDAGERVGEVGGPMLFIASEWSAGSSPRVRVFSNCEQVELRLNGGLVARQSPDRGRMDLHLAHPPFTFQLPRFTPGTLEAVGLIGGNAVARHRVSTPGPLRALDLWIDRAGRAPAAGEKDLIFVHAELCDAAGNRVASAWENVAFGCSGAARLIGDNPFASDAGVSSSLLETAGAGAAPAVFALGLVRADDGVRLLGAATGISGPAPPFTLRYTLDGSDPGPASPRYTGPLATRARVRAALLGGGRVLARLDEGAPRPRMRASTPPERRDPFHHGSAAGGGARPRRPPAAPIRVDTDVADD